MENYDVLRQGSVLTSECPSIQFQEAMNFIATNKSISTQDPRTKVKSTFKSSVIRMRNYYLVTFERNFHQQKLLVFKFYPEVF